MDRLFVPTNKKPFLYFSTGEKEWEVRKNKGKFSTRRIYHGQIAEIRKGYSSEESIWGKIPSLVFSETIKGIIGNVSYKKIIPWVSNKKEAEIVLKDILGKSDEGYVAFELDKSIPRIDLSEEYKGQVLNRDKTTTIRKGIRSYETGPALFDVGGEKIPIEICGLENTTFDKITEADAKRDGFKDVEELENALTGHYPDISSDEAVTIVSFRARIKD